VELVTLALAIAAAVHIWIAGSLFHDVRKWLSPYRQSPRWYVRVPAVGLLCHFCLSCQIALGYGLWSGDVLTGLAAILPANASIALFLIIARAAERDARMPRAA
jgi:hypothetical protein